jgi:hypothetical protein
MPKPMVGRLSKRTFAVLGLSGGGPGAIGWVARVARKRAWYANRPSAQNVKRMMGKREAAFVSRVSISGSRPHWAARADDRRPASRTST